jgi:quinol monooxygenase YgiN
MVIVTGRVRATPDTLDEALALAREHVERSRAEPGCLEHSVLRDVEVPSTLVFFERWADRDALAAHFRVPESVAFVEAVTELAIEAPELHVYDVEDRPAEQGETDT